MCMRGWISRVASVAIALGCGTSMALDLAINDGRILDPESGLDAVRSLGIEHGRIVRISRSALSADRVIDATNRVVAPGFIDLHAHGQDVESNRFQAADGVTTALELEIGVYPVRDWYASRAGSAPIHYGASSSHVGARAKLLAGVDFGSPAAAQAGSISDLRVIAQALDEGEIQALNGLIDAGIAEGGLGIGLGLTYTPGASHSEILELFRLAARRQVPVYVHMRQARQLGGDLLAPLQEVLADAAATGAPLHVVHLNSSLDDVANVALGMIRGARMRGLDVTTEAYPYTASATRLESALFDDYQGDPAQLQWVETGERLDAASFAKYRAHGGWVILHGRSEAMNAWLVAQPDVMVASDGIPWVNGFSHPRSAGTYARVLGRYVRDAGALTLIEAVAKMSLLPARRLEAFAPAFARKGRIARGMDADLVIFDAQTVLDRATYLAPAQTSAGIRHVLVSGVAVVAHGEPVPDTFPGHPLLATPR